MKTDKTFDVVVVGAGVFGAWTAYQLRRDGAEVALLDSYGAGNSRSSSGGESRIFRLGYGADEIYTDSARRSQSMWEELSATQPAHDPLFRRAGVLWLASEQDPYVTATRTTFEKFGVNHEVLNRNELEQRFPQINFATTKWGVLEPDSGLLLARRAVRVLVSRAIELGVCYEKAAVIAPAIQQHLTEISTSSGKKVYGDKFVFACGPWLPKLFPALLSKLIRVTRQEVYFFGVPPGERVFDADQMPVWIDFNNQVYCLPNVDGRGVKVAIDAHGPEFDPDSNDRVFTSSLLDEVRARLARRLPGLSQAPVTETRVCQYENTSTGDFLIDSLPGSDNMWVVGGGSGHGFKHGPAVGAYVSGLIKDRIEGVGRFSLKSKKEIHQRSVF